MIAYNEYDRVMRLLERLEKKSLVNEKQKCSPSSLMGSQTPRFREGRKEMLDSSPPNPLHGHCPAWLQGELTLRKNITQNRCARNKSRSILFQLSYSRCELRGGRVCIFDI